MNRFFMPFLCLALTHAIHAETVRIGVFTHYPIVMQNPADGRPDGPGVEYAKAVARALGYEPETRLLPVSRIISYLKNGELDMAIGFGMTEERKAYLLYADEPSIVYHPSITVLSGHRLGEISSVNDLAGMKIGYLLGAYTGSFFKGAQAVEFDLISGDRWIEQNLGKLLLGRIDGILDQNDYSCIAAARRKGVEDKVKVLRLPVEGVKSYVVFSKASPKGTRLLRAFNELDKSAAPNQRDFIEGSLLELLTR
jgi:ABC-type amino acid transport substrate-binding protein